MSYSRYSDKSICKKYKIEKVPVFEILNVWVFKNKKSGTFLIQESKLIIRQNKTIVVNTFRYEKS